MTYEELKDRINNISIWKKGDERAPHKPLLILYALSEFVNSGSSELPYSTAKDKIKGLLIEFGPKRSSYHPEEPFVRLEKDGLWQLSQPVDTNNIWNKFLLEHQVSGQSRSSKIYHFRKKRADKRNRGVGTKQPLSGIDA